jgi:hypothetical protein
VTAAAAAAIPAFKVIDFRENPSAALDVIVDTLHEWIWLLRFSHWHFLL